LMAYEMFDGDHHQYSMLFVEMFDLMRLHT